MLNTNLKLNKQIFSDNCEQKSTRDGFGEGLLILGEQNENICALSADLTGSLKADKFKARFPSRFFEVGIAEQNMAGIASGLASQNKIPFMLSYSVFSPGRNWEIIRTTICYNDVPVKIIGSHSGLDTGPDGATHQCLEDLSLMRVLPNMVVVSPCDSIEAKKATIAIGELDKPCYLRLQRGNTKVVTTQDTPFEIGKANVLYNQDETEVALISHGNLVSKVLEVANELEKEKINCTVINNHTIKPLDRETLIHYAKTCKAFVIIEDHQKIGGLGSAISELLSETCPIPIEFVAVNDLFGETGKTTELYAKHKLDNQSIKNAVKKVLKRKNS